MLNGRWSSSPTPMTPSSGPAAPSPSWTGAGIQVTYCVLTDGNAGGYDPNIPRADIPAIRRAEQHNAAAILGVSDIRFLGLGEGALRPASRDLHENLVRIIRQVRPQRVLTWSPEWNWQRFRSCHPDHLATGTAALTAIYPDAGNPFALPHLATGEGLGAWTVTEAWLLNSAAREINHYVDITATFDRKVTAVRAHRSQIKDPRNSSRTAARADRPEHAGGGSSGRPPGRGIPGRRNRLAARHSGVRLRVPQAARVPDPGIRPRPGS